MRKSLVVSIDTINLFFLCLLSALLIFTPLYSYKKMIILLIVFTGWFITAARDKYWNRRALPIIVILLALMALDFVSALGNDNSLIFLNFITQKLFVYIWILIFSYYVDKKNIIEKAIPIILTLVMISSFFTIRGNLLFPGASRLLASENVENSIYRSLFIGGYDFIYGLVFVVLPLYVYLKRTLHRKIFYLFCLTVFLVSIVTGAYTIAILLSLAMLIGAFINPEKKIAWIILLLIVSLISLFSEQLLDLMIYIGNLIGSNILVTRAEMIRYRDFVEGSGENRLVLYGNGLMNFANNFFFGRMIGNPQDSLHSGHSALINYLESYGLFSLAYFIYLKKSFSVIYNSLKNFVTKQYYVIYFVILLMFMLLNTIDTSNGIGFFAFFFGPILLLCSERSTEN